MQLGPEQSTAVVSEALCIIDDAWTELRRSPYVQLLVGDRVIHLPDVSFADTERRSGVGDSLLKRLEFLEVGTLPHELKLALRLVRFRAQSWSRESQWYWTVCDPLGIGYFGLFLPTPYCGGKLLDVIKNQLASFVFSEAGDEDCYLALVTDYGRLIDQFAERTAGQAHRGIRMPKVQVRQARALLAALRNGVRSSIGVTSGRLTRQPARRFLNELEVRIAAHVEPAYERALEGLSATYYERAPEEVGIRQYLQGEAIYAELVKVHTTLNVTAEQVHSLGTERLKGIEESICDVQKELGFRGNDTAFVAHLDSDPKWRAKDAAGVAAMFERYINRLQPLLGECFSSLPQASYGVSPLPEALQSSMTFGYYDPPRSNRRRGLYMFNTENLTKQSLFNVGALTYHELMPGHHLHFATQDENRKLLPFQTFSFVNAYAEGWAEYAASLAGELGMYQLPEERYGRLIMDAFLTSRLVVDTGMNVFGWSLDRARDYMRRHSRVAEAEILTESVRYSCDIPGQSLAYKLGDTHILALRERMRQALGTHFSLKGFHSAVLRHGALPMSDLDFHIDYEIERLRELAGV